MKKIIFVNIIVIVTLVIVLEILIRYLNIVSLQGFDKEFFISENNITLNKPYSKNLVVAGKRVKTDENGFRIPLEGYELKDNNKSISYLDLDYKETRNQYSVYVYFSPIWSNYDRLIGIGKSTSNGLN